MAVVFCLRPNKQIGKLNVEKDYLKKKYRQLYGKEPD